MKKAMSVKEKDMLKAIGAALRAGKGAKAKGFSRYVRFGLVRSNAEGKS